LLQSKPRLRRKKKLYGFVGLFADKKNLSNSMISTVYFKKLFEVVITLPIALTELLKVKLIKAHRWKL